MELHNYPRPANDTGIGIHWSPGYATAVGMGKIRDFWIPELKAMGVKWVKIFNHDGAHDLAELLLLEGFMPIVRIFRAAPNPGRLSVKDLVHIDSFIRIGVRYFEFNSEPDRDAEWKGGRVPANAIDIVVEDAIADMDAILERGGMPGIPAVSTGSRWDLVGKIIDVGRRDLLNGPVWQAIHNYCHNRPLDYPYDIGNQEGAAFTDRFYRTLRAERWGADAWQGRALAEINRLRLNHCNPGATVMDDHACWLAYEFFDTRIRRHLGRSIPILSTECGYVVGEGLDLRYPTTTPDLHMAQTLEACRIMMGTSQRYNSAIDVYFCTAFMLLANHSLGGTGDWWESYAWYSSQWPGGALPITKALRGEPKSARRWQNRLSQGERITLYGSVLHAGSHRTLVLDQNGEEQARVVLDAHGRYRIPDLPPGSYTLRVEETTFVEAVTLTADQRETILNLDLGKLDQVAGQSIVAAQVRGGAGAVVILLRADDGEEWVGMARDDGSVRFIDLPPGLYSAQVQPNGQRVDGIVLDGKSEVNIALAVEGWGYTIRLDAPPAPPTDGALGLSLNLIRCAVEGHRDVVVRARAEAWESKPVRTGSAYAYGPYACEITLPTDRDYSQSSYTLIVEGIVDETGQPVPLEAQVQPSTRGIPFVEFTYTEPAEQKTPHESLIAGRVIGGTSAENGLRVALYDSQARCREQLVDETGVFRFQGLTPGLYTVLVVGHEATAYRTDIGLDGHNQVMVELAVPVAADFESQAMPVEEATPYAEPEAMAGNSTIMGLAPSAAGRLARLSDAVGNEYTTFVGPDERFVFDLLPAGTYSLAIEGGYVQGELYIDGADGLEIFLSPLEQRWIVEITEAGSMPGFSAIRVEVTGQPDLPVYLFKAEDEEADPLTRTTGSKPEWGEFALEFTPLPPGRYFVEPANLDVRAEVELTGLEAVWVNFSAHFVPTSPNVVVPLGMEVTTVGVSESVPNLAAQEEISPPSVAETQTHARTLDRTEPAHKGHTYLFIGNGFSVDELAGSQESASLLRFITQVQPTIGSDAAVAAQARSVIVVGEVDGDVIEVLSSHGARLELVYDDLVGALGRLGL